MCTELKHVNTRLFKFHETHGNAQEMSGAATASSSLTHTANSTDMMQKVSAPYIELSEPKVCQKHHKMLLMLLALIAVELLCVSPLQYNITAEFS